MKTVLSKNLSLLRKANNFSQEDVADFLGISRSAYGNYETGDRIPNFATLEKLSNLFGCDLHLLFEENSTVVEEMLVCAFRVDSLTPEDLMEVANFKNIVKNYIKMDQIS